MVETQSFDLDLFLLASLVHQISALPDQLLPTVWHPRQAPILGRAISAQSAGPIDIADRLLMAMHGRAVQSPTGPIDIDEELDLSHWETSNFSHPFCLNHLLHGFGIERHALQESSDEADAEPQEEEERATGQVSREAGHMLILRRQITAGSKMNEENVQRSLRFDVTEFKLKKRECVGNTRRSSLEGLLLLFTVNGWLQSRVSLGVALRGLLDGCVSHLSHAVWQPIPFGWIEHVANEKPDSSIAILLWILQDFCLSAIVLRKVPKSWIYCCQFGLPFGQLVSLEPLPPMPRSLEWWVCNDFVQLTWTNKNKSYRELFDPLRKPSTLPVSESMAFRWVWVSAFHKLKSQCNSWGVSKHLFRTCPVEMCWPPLAW